MNCMTELKIDIDRDKTIRNSEMFHRERFEKQVKKLLQIYGLEWARTEVYTTKHGYHVYCELNGEQYLTATDVILCQALLGSDPDREMYNLHRIKHPVESVFKDVWNVLFSTKWKGGHVWSREKKKESFIITVSKD
jgi:hypothetical protein